MVAMVYEHTHMCAERDGVADIQNGAAGVWNLSGGDVQDHHQVGGTD